MIFQTFCFYFNNTKNYYHNYIYNYIKDNISIYETQYPYINTINDIISLKEYIQSLNIYYFFSRELKIKLTSDIFNINIIVSEHKPKYKDFIQKLIFSKDNNKIKPIMFL